MSIMEMIIVVIPCTPHPPISRLTPRRTRRGASRKLVNDGGSSGEETAIDVTEEEIIATFSLLLCTPSQN